MQRMLIKPQKSVHHLDPPRNDGQKFTKCPTTLKNIYQYPKHCQKPENLAKAKDTQ